MPAASSAVIFSSLNGQAVVRGAIIVSGWLNVASSAIAQGLHAWTPVERALGVLAAAFVGGWMLARPLQWVLRVGIIVVGVLVAARLAGVAA